MTGGEGVGKDIQGIFLYKYFFLLKYSLLLYRAVSKART